MSSPFTEDQFRDLIEREHQLDELEETSGWQTLKAEVGKTLAEDRRRLLGGHVKDHDDYLMTAWRIRGAESVLEFPQATRELVVKYREQMAERENGGLES